MAEVRAARSLGDALSALAFADIPMDIQVPASYAARLAAGPQNLRRQ